MNNNPKKAYKCASAASIQGKKNSNFIYSQKNHLL